jgi:hypothetical protein
MVKFVGAVFKPVKTFLRVSADEGLFQPETETRSNWSSQTYKKKVKLVGAVFKLVGKFLLVTVDEGFVQLKTGKRNNSWRQNYKLNQ